jgi:hypothetical protein
MCPFFVQFILFNQQAPEIIISESACNETTSHSNHNRPFCQPQYAWWWRDIHSEVKCLRQVVYRGDQQITCRTMSIISKRTIYLTLPSRRILNSWQSLSWSFTAFKANHIYIFLTFSKLLANSRFKRSNVNVLVWQRTCITIRSLLRDCW